MKIIFFLLVLPFIAPLAALVVAFIRARSPLSATSPVMRFLMHPSTAAARPPLASLGLRTLPLDGREDLPPASYRQRGFQGPSRRFPEFWHACWTSWTNVPQY